MTSVEEVKLNVAASVDQALRAVLGIQVVTEQLDEAMARLRLTAVGSVHPTVLTAVGQLEQARVRLEEAASLIRGATDSANTYRTVV
jgi:hypothetical protein